MSEREALVPEYRQYQRKQIAEMADWHLDFDMTGVSVSNADRQAGSPKIGDKIARNPKNHADKWLVAADYFADNFAALTAPQQEPVAWMWPHTPNADCPLKPGSWRTSMCFGIEKPRGRSDAIPLYTAPPSGVREDVHKRLMNVYHSWRQGENRQIDSHWAAMSLLSAMLPPDSAAEQVNAEGHTRIPVYLDQCAPSAPTPQPADGDALISITDGGSTHTRTAREWLALARTDLFSQPADGVVVPREECECPVEGHMQGCPNDKLGALLAAAKEPRK